MIYSNEYKDQENKESDTALVPSELHILVTDADTNGYEISKMSDFMGLYAQQLTRSLADSPFVEVVSNIPVADLGIINDVVQHAAVVARGNITLVPDFDSLPAGIKEKLKQGLYSIGDSKQVDGNLRAVIVDKNGVRVKDITLKKVINNPGTLETTRSIANQMQMKQIQDTLKGIQEMQSYQLDRDRDRDILTPFFDARDYILQAQNAASIESRNQFLEKASDRMTTALNSVYAEMRTASLHLAKNTKWSLFHKQSSIDTLLSNLSDDLLLLCKQAAKNFHTICKKETALKRVLNNLLSAVSLLRFKAVFSCGFRVPPGSGLYQSCAAGSVCIPAGQKYCSPRPRKSCPADRKTPGLPSRCIGHRW